MKKLILVLCFLNFSYCFSQTLNWEREFLIDDTTLTSASTGLYPNLIDSDGNIVVLLDVNPDRTPYFYKCDKFGNLISIRKFTDFTSNKFIFPAALCQTDFGYKIFSGTNSTAAKFSYTSLPVIINTDKNGDTINIDYPYQDNQNNYSSASFTEELFYTNKTTLYFNNKFYNATVHRQVKVDSTNSIVKDHLTISCYDTTGKIEWRKGDDTLEFSDKYFIADLKQTKDKNFLVLGNINPKTTRIFKFDTNGRVFNRIDLTSETNPIFVYSIVELNNGNYAVLARYDIKSFFIREINIKGDSINQISIPNPNNTNQFLVGLKKAPNGSVIAFGRAYFSEPNTYFYLFCADSNLKYLWEYKWMPYVPYSDLRDLTFIDNENFVCIGFRNRVNFYISEFSLIPSNVIENTSNKEQDLKVSPNPAADYIEINFERCATLGKCGTSGYIQIFNTLGEIILTVEQTPSSVQKIDISNLSPGIYFIKIGNKVEKFVKM